MKKKSVTIHAHAVALALCGVTAGISAQETSREGGRSTGLEEVIVTAQKREQNLQDVPVSVVALDAEQLSRAQVDSISDLAEISPSFNLQAGVINATVNYSMRGIGAFAPQPAIQPAVGVVVDGVPYARQTEFDADFGDVDSVQMITGAQGTLFGLNTIGGVVNVTTRQPTSSFEGFVGLSAADDGEYAGRFGLGGPLSERVRARALIYGKDARGYIKNVFPGAKRTGADETHGARVKVDFDLTDALQLKIMGDYRKSALINPSDDTIVIGTPALTVLGNGDAALGQRVLDDPSLSNDDITREGNIEIWGVGADLSWRLADALTLRSISSYRELVLSSTLAGESTPASPSNTFGLPQVAARRTNLALNEQLGIDIDSQVFNNVEYYTQELRLESTGSRVDWLVGGFYNHNDELVGNETPLVLGNRTLAQTARRGIVALRSWSAFGDATVHVSESWDVFAGLRWTDERMNNDYFLRSYVVPSALYTVEPGGIIQVTAPVSPSAVRAFVASTTQGDWSGRVGARWVVNPDLNFYVSGARGYTGLGADTSQTARVESPFLDPTTAASYEVGVKSMSFNRRMRLNAAVFKTNVDDLQAVIFGTGQTGAAELRTINAGTLDTQGVELSFMALLGDRLSLSGALTFLDTEIGGGVRQRCYAGQTAAQGCFDSNGDGTPDQSVDGKPGLNAPRWKYNVSATYEMPVASFGAFATAAYTWKDRTEFELTYDPIASHAESVGLLDVTLGLAANDGRYEISLFGKNVLDKHYLGLQRAVAVNARANGIYPRGAFAYWGIKMQYNF